jgi:hypothetical protein
MLLHRRQKARGRRHKGQGWRQQQALTRLEVGEAVRDLEDEGEAGREAEDEGEAGRDAEEEGDAGREAEDDGDAGPDLLALLVGELLGLAFMDLLEEGLLLADAGMLLLGVGELEGEAGALRVGVRLQLAGTEEEGVRLWEAPGVPEREADGKLQPGVGITVGWHSWS